MADTSDRPILVAGATGRQGGSVVRHLLGRQLTVRALARDPHSDRAKALAGQGIEIVQGDMDDLASLKKAMTGVRGVYSVQDYFTAGILTLLPVVSMLQLRLHALTQMTRRFTPDFA